MTREQVAKRICALVKERGISKYQLAKKCPEVSQSTIYNATRGKGTMGLDTLNFIFRGLEITPADFFNWDEEDTAAHLTEDERTVVETMRRVPEKEKQRIVGYALSLSGKAERNKSLKGKETR